MPNNVDPVWMGAFPQSQDPGGRQLKIVYVYMDMMLGYRL